MAAWKVRKWTKIIPSKNILFQWNFQNHPPGKSQENTATAITADASTDMVSQKFTVASASFRWSLKSSPGTVPLLDGLSKVHRGQCLF